MVERKFKFSKFVLTLILIVVSLSMIVPILNIVAKSISDPSQVSKMNGFQIWPSGLSFIHYKAIFQNDTVWKALLNSVFITVMGVTINLLLTASAAYALTRKNLRGKKIMMVFLIIIMIFEPGIIQEFFLIQKLNLLDNLWSMVLYKSVSVYNLILLMRFFSETPEALLEAAKIDGAGHMKILFKIFIPLNRVPILTIGMFYAVYRWNEFFHSSIFLSSRKNMVLQVFLRQFVVDGDTTALSALGTLDLSSVSIVALRAATIVVVMVPILALYPLILKYYTSGVLSGGIKE